MLVRFEDDLEMLLPAIARYLSMTHTRLVISGQRAENLVCGHPAELYAFGQGRSGRRTELKAVPKASSDLKPLSAPGHANDGYRNFWQRFS
jgi:hypothetical protein